ncbi:MAG TPA: site-specific DNA-methyltransferase [candidate division Zixibacteria bacterium]|nr:site-specific DNA-methyltransferase [candidate division Zixibacteria bacterium]
METNTIYYEDCIENISKRIPNNSVDLIIADPPFGIKFDGKGAQYNRKSEFVVSGYSEISREDYQDFSKAWIKAIYPILKKTGSAYIISGWTNLKAILIAIDDAGFITKNHIIWKYQFGVFTKRKFVTSHYHILFLVKDDKDYYFNKVDHYPEDVWEIKRDYKPGQKKNSTKLPDALIEKLILYSSRPGDIILDPFMGNGTTATVSLRLNRKYLGFEINPEAKEIIEMNIKSTLKEIE